MLLNANVTQVTILFVYLPGQSGYNRRLKSALPLVKDAIRMVAADSDFWFDNHWISNATPVPCARTGKYTLIDCHPKRGTAGIDALGVLTGFTGVPVGPAARRACRSISENSSSARPTTCSSPWIRWLFSR